MVLERLSRSLLRRQAPSTGEPELNGFALTSSHSGIDCAPPPEKCRKRDNDADVSDDWTDTSRPRIASEKPFQFRPQLPVVSAERAVDLLIAWANDVGVTGLFTSQEIDDLWRRANKELGLAEIRPMFVREALAGRNLWLGKRRTLTPEYASVRQRTGAERAVLYRLPAISEEVGQKPDQAPDGPDLMPGSVRSNGGPGMVPTEKTNSSRCLLRSSMARSRYT